MAIKKFKPKDILNPRDTWEQTLFLRNDRDDLCCGINRISCIDVINTSFALMLDRIKACTRDGVLNLAVVCKNYSEMEEAYEQALQKCRFSLLKTWVNYDTGNKLSLYGKYVKPKA